MTEEQLLQAVRDLARIRGWLVHRVFSDGPAPVFVGLMLVHSLEHGLVRQVLYAQVLSARGVPSVAQQAWRVALQRAGEQVEVWRPHHLPGGDVAVALTPLARVRASVPVPRPAVSR